MSTSRRLVAASVAVCIAFTGMARPAFAAGGLISTEEVAAGIDVRDAHNQRARLLAALDRSDVVTMLAERGVSAEQARARVRSLSDAEVQRLAAEIDTAPAGGSELIGTLILVFVLLVFSDILGFTNLFPFIKPAS